MKVVATITAFLAAAGSAAALRPTVAPTMTSEGPVARRGFLRFGSAAAAAAVGVAAAPPAHAEKAVCLPWDYGAKYYEVGSFECKGPAKPPAFLSDEAQASAKAQYEKELAENLKKSGKSLSDVKNQAKLDAEAAAKAAAAKAAS
eukprot:CAMPEP_0205921508 /NCGR_PEP_ID=MMETSP1325-20131115/12909_1 /ASSEMBLY_ACC=CAM_ASM_000708 /TAXON_ID=236786 /ORGANISM="Florenciella sp., Strain RCC1007" /LENGTH=144 /DNA_ID=CAMNT_0053289341 /DNA_START=36 /DNA_END=470 /DNA_ORIENTATION=+